MSDKTLPITGGCMCGAVRYEADEPPTRILFCHCRKCQQAYGNAFGIFASINTETFRFTRGQPAFYRSSTWAERGFCATCGTPLVFRDATDTIGVMVGSLDNPEDWPPTVGRHLGLESALSWLKIDDDLPRLRTEDDPEYIKARRLADPDWNGKPSR